MRSHPRITASAEIDSLPNYMYFQKMKTKTHSLQRGRYVSIKNRAHLPMVYLGLISYEVTILPLFRYAYFMINLSITPHGSETILNKHQVETVLFRSNIPQLNVQHGDHSGEIDLTDYFGLVVIYSNSWSINKVANATQYVMTLLAPVLDTHNAGS
jgi:hypothetical protein